ncbi:MAG: hypothetical protein ABJC05_03740 [Pyrinomonadaceae bacterium]
MSCDEIQVGLSLYDDDALALSTRLACDDHLRLCPVCRAQLAELRSLARNLGRLTRALPPPNLATTISQALATEAGAREREPVRPLAVQIANWLQPRLLPYAVSSFASILLFSSMFAGLRPHMVALREAQVANETSKYAAGAPSTYDINRPISSESYAALRAPYSVESPSLDPRGALAAMTRSLSHGHDVNNTGSDDMIVVADVYSNGNASLASVVYPPRDQRMLDEFQDALRKNAAFVPASLDGRPDTMRVVFTVQKVDVRENNF